MHKYLLIALLLVFSCTEKKQQREEVVLAEVEEQEPVKSKKYIYTDTTVEAAPVQSTTVEPQQEVVVQPPAAEEQYDDEEAVTDTVEIDTVVYRWNLSVSPDSVNQWKKMNSFAYVKYMDSLLKAAKEKKKEELSATPPARRTGGSWLDGILGSGGLQAFLWILAAAFIIFIIYQLFVTNGTFKRNVKKTTTAAPEAEEEIITPESDFDRMIREALQQRNYRLAVRYHYLQTLHALAEKKYVQLAADKTNYSYVREIADYEKQNAFAGLTLNYEYVWYGEFAIDELVYGRLKNEFQLFNTKI